MKRRLAAHIGLAWVAANTGKYDFIRYGWPAWYPTRALQEWKTACQKWQPYVFRAPDENTRRPVIAHARKKK